MEEIRRMSRASAIALVGTASIIAGLLGIWYFATPEMIPRLGTWALLGVLAMFALPLVVVAAWKWDRARAEAEHNAQAASEEQSKRRDEVAAETVASRDMGEVFVKREPWGPSTSQWAEGRTSRRNAGHEREPGEVRGRRRAGAGRR